MERPMRTILDVPGGCDSGCWAAEGRAAAMGPTIEQALRMQVSADAGRPTPAP